MTSAFLTVYLREIRIARRLGGSGSMGVVFFLTLVTITPFAVGPDPNLLARIGPAMLWISALLASLLGSTAVPGRRRGRLARSVSPLAYPAGARGARQMRGPLDHGRPAPGARFTLFGLMLQQDGAALFGVVASLLAGTPALTLIGAIGAAATVTLRRGGLLMALLVLPLAIPVLIFGVSAANAAAGGTVPF